MQLAVAVFMNARAHSLRGPILCALVCSLALASCAAGNERFSATAPAGFWFGLWHGLISLITLVVGLFDSDVEIYERANNGAWYDFGFVLGAAFMWGSGHHSHRRWKWSRRECDDIPAGRVKVDISWKPDKDEEHDERDEDAHPDHTRPDHL